MESMPYLKIVKMPRQMAGTGAPQPTLFGVLGHTKISPEMKTLGGLVETKTRGVSEKVTESAKSVDKNTEKGMIGPSAKTHISGQHYGQVPYAGKYFAPLGSRV